MVGNDGKAQARTIVPGDWFGKDWAILQGLNAGDEVIVDNLLKVRPGAPVNVAAAAPPATPAAPATPGAGNASPAK